MAVSRKEQALEVSLSVQELIDWTAALILEEREYTRKQEGLLRPQDAVAIAKYLGKKLDPWQERVLNATAHDALLLVTRQGGKGEITALIALDMAINHPGSTIVIISRADRQARRLLRRVKAYYRQLPDVPPVLVDNVSTWELANGSEIIALPGSEETTRGIDSVDLLLIDEAGLVPDELYQAVYPMLAVTDGKCMAMTSARGKRGWFYKEWVEGGDDWHRERITWEQIPESRLKRSFVARVRRRLGEFMFRQEFECNPPEAPIWMGDYSFKPLGDVKPGDVVIGWAQPEGKQKRHLTRTTVLATHRRISELVELRMESGRIIRCTPDHKWLTPTAGTKGSYYRPARIGGDLIHVIDPTDPVTPDLAWDAAWLGGIYDGEGSADHIAQSSTANPAIYARITAVLERLGFRWSEHAAGVYFKSADGRAGRKQAMVNFVNWCRPTMINQWMDQIILGAHFQKRDRVIAVSSVGQGDVVSMQTETGNYVVWGYASKNCEFMDDVTQMYASDLVARALKPGGVSLGLPKLSDRTTELTA